MGVLEVVGASVISVALKLWTPGSSAAQATQSSTTKELATQRNRIGWSSARPTRC
jgi:hypothetical protein